MTQDYEKLGAFYLGRLFDLEQRACQPDLLLYESRDLTTHAVCVGMTGSGKTGLCVSLLEEAAIDGIPVIAIDPKGDLGNLLLTFPDLSPHDFQPWMDEAEASRKELSPEQFAAQVAQTWREGLASWGQDAERIARLRSAVDMTIFTPGSSAGVSLSVLQSFAAPPPEVVRDDDVFRSRVAAAAAGLLTLLGIDADPLASPEHILLSNLFDREWREGRDLDLAGLIRLIQTPPFEKIGFMDLETVFPAKQRLALAMQLNNLIASPAFAGWTQGEPLSVKRLLYTAQGRPRLSIISIAHLSDTERMFFVTLLLNEVLAWIRSQPGTNSLRAVLYMDEVFGYFPPTANPPCKTPMLTLLKQARAYGLGIVLATQNPVDLDYKGLSNTGTWFLGRLQTERDKARVIDGLEGVSATAGTPFDRNKMEATLASLSNRVFLMNNVHDDEPVVFQTRWALSYLRGPLTGKQIQRLMADRKATPTTADQQSDAASTGREPGYGDSSHTASSPTHLRPTPAEDVPHEPATQTQRPIVPPQADEAFLVPRRPCPEGSRILYRPALLGVGRLHFVRATYRIDTWSKTSLMQTTIDPELADVWSGAGVLTDGVPNIEKAPNPVAEFAAMPAECASPRNYTLWEKQLKGYLYRQGTMTVWHCKALKEYSQPNEAEDDFRIRLGHAAHEQRDQQVEKLRQRYTKKLVTIRDRIARAEQRVDREKSQYRQQQFQTAVSFGTSLIGALFGRKLASRTNVSRAGSAMRSAGRTARERGDIGRARETVEELRMKLDELEDDLRRRIEKVEQTFRASELDLEQRTVSPRKSDITVEQVQLIWTPWHVDSHGVDVPAFSEPARRLAN